MHFHDSTKGGVVPVELAKMIRNPSTVNARIFIGNISNGIDLADLETIFGKHGDILGIVLNRGFAFLQYSDDMAAMQAINKECGRPYRGRNLDVKQARTFSSGGGHGGGSSGRLDRDRERSPHEFGGDSFRDRSPDRRMRLDDRRGGVSSMGARGHGDWLDRERDRYESFEGREVDRFYSSRDNSYEDNFHLAPSDHSRDYGLPIPYREIPPAADFPPSSNVANVDRTNDCEIIVVNKSTTEYAEFIERRLKKVGLTVDLLFPNEEVPLGRVLANISGRGTLYAIVVSHQNEEHRSLTLNILHGQPQEHRNMPQEDAITLISRNFDSYMRGEKGQAVVPAGGLVAVPDRHPEAIQTLLNLLRENRQLTVLQYDKVIRYLQERREVQVKVELGETNNSPLTGDGPTSKQQAELQNRILTILNKNIDSNKTAPLPLPVPTPAPRPTPLLNDPTVQRALDSLIQGDLLNKLGGGGVQGAQGGGALFGAFASAGQRKF